MRTLSLTFLLAAVAALAPPASAKTRVWIDTDPACGLGATRDPDDCLALLYLLAAPDLEIAGISTTFGNAGVDEVTGVAKALLDKANQRLPLHAGAGRNMGRWQTSRTDASQAIARALAAKPMTFIALGPLTNLATALKEQPTLAANVVRLVAVMGKEPGEIFHPAEGSPDAILGHGPIFTDLNFAQDTRAAEAVFATGIDITLVPYAAGKTQRVTAADLTKLARRGPTAAWVARSARDWLAYWHNVIGRDAFYPFDLVAAVAAVEPGRSDCVTRAAAIRRDDKIGWFGGGPMSLLFERESAPGGRRVTECRTLTGSVIETLDATLARQGSK